MKTSLLLFAVLFLLQWTGDRSLNLASEPPMSATEQAESEKAWEAFELSDLLAARQRSDDPWLEFLDVSTLSSGIYVLAAGAEDKQTPHDEDEVYYVILGRAILRMGDEDRAVGPGSIAYVKAHVEHRFHHITEDLQVLVFFSKAKPASPHSP